MLNSDTIAPGLIVDLVKKLNDYSETIMSKGSYFYAFNPSQIPDADTYQGNMMLIDAIYEVLNEYGINIKSRGYTFIKDAVCIIVDKKSMDVCLDKEVYPFIAKKYNVKGNYAVEHSIRNAIKAAYMHSADRFIEEPTNKSFILMTVQKVSARLGKHPSCD